MYAEVVTLEAGQRRLRIAQLLIDIVITFLEII